MPEQLQLSFDAPALTAEEAAVWGCIKNRRGRGNEIIGPRISEVTGIEYDRIRAIIRHLRRHHRKLIGSSGAGYYIPVTRDELMEYTRSMRRRGIMVLVMVSEQIGASLEEVFNQGRLEL